MPSTEAGSSPSPLDRMGIVVCGHVDHGKSTIVGRLLADTGSLPDGKLEQLKALCARTSKPFEYAFLVDALKDERAQGITIDAARVFFRTPARDVEIIDAPGHIEFLKNMITGAARAQAALLVIDANEGIQENSRRHGYLISMLGIRHLAVLVNKMDLAGFSESEFSRIENEYRAFLDRIGVTPAAFIPVAGRDGDNIAGRSERMTWYRGPTVLEMLDAFPASAVDDRQPFRMPVQDVYKFTGRGDDRRIVAGTVESGRARAGDEVVFYPSGKRSVIKTIEAFGRSHVDSAAAGEATGFTLREQIYVARGEIATVASGTPQPQVSARLRVSLFWLGQNPLVATRPYVLKLGTARATVRVETIHRVINAANLDVSESASQVNRHEVAECTLACSRAIAFDLPETVAATSRFVIVDEYDICGGGIVREALPDLQRLAPSAPSTAAVVWLTGLPASGKSTLAQWLEAELRGRGLRVEMLDGDAMRTVFPQTGFSKADRDAHIKRTGYLASRLEHHGVTVIASFVSPYRESRDFVRQLCRNFVEVHVATPLEECERRDTKGMYAKARLGDLQSFTGISDPYEAPLSPDLVIDTTHLSVDEAGRRVLQVLDAASEQAGRA